MSCPPLAGREEWPRDLCLPALPPFGVASTRKAGREQTACLGDQASHGWSEGFLGEGLRWLGKEQAVQRPRIEDSGVFKKQKGGREEGWGGEVGGLRQVTGEGAGEGGRTRPSREGIWIYPM